MIKFLKNLLSYKITFSLKKPARFEILVFDDVSFNDLKYVLENKRYYLLPVRADRIKEIIITFNFFKFFFKFFFLLKNKRGIILTSYLAAVIDLVKPKIVLSHIDNSIKYSQISILLKNKIKFLTIQNASRYDVFINDLSIKKNLKTKTDNYILYIQNFLCFGQFEVDVYNKIQHKVDNFYKIGSLRKSNFFRYIHDSKKKLIPNLFKLGVLLERPLPTPGLIPDVPDFIYSFVMPIKYSIKYAQSHKLKTVFICKGPQVEKELENYADYLSKEEKNFIKNNVWERSNKEFSSYEAVFQTEVLVGMASTLLREKISSKQKILSCNYSKADFWNFPIEGISFLNQEGYNKFEKRLNLIFTMSINEYVDQLKKHYNYVGSEGSNQETLRRIISMIEKETQNNTYQ